MPVFLRFAFIFLLILDLLSADDSADDPLSTCLEKCYIKDYDQPVIKKKQ